MSHIHFLFDEAGPYARLPSITTAFIQGRAYKIKCVLCIQSLGQLRTCFPEDGGQTLLSNCAQIYVGTRDYPTAEAISNMLGDRTAIVDSGGSGDGISRQNADNGNSQSVSHNNNYNWSQISQRLLKPDQVLTLHPRWAICFAPGLPPIMVWTHRYYEGGCGKKTPKWRICVDVICWFVLSVMIASLATGVFLQR